MPAPAGERQLLLAALAVQMGFVNHEQMAEAMKAWAADRSRPLADVLSERGALNTGDRAALEGLVDRHLARHGGDPAESLLSLSLPPATPDAIDTTDVRP